MQLKSIGMSHTPHKQQTGPPVQPRWAENIEGRVEVVPEYSAGLSDLDGFERIWLVGQQLGGASQGGRTLFAVKQPNLSL